AGIRADVFEMRADPKATQVGGGFHIWANGVKAARAMGLEARVQEIGATIEETGFYGGRGQQLALWPVGEVSREVGAGDYGVSRGDLQRVLHEEVGADAVSSSAQLTGFSEDKDGITATFADGRQEYGDLLVGADGLRSTVRASLLGDGPPDYAGYTQWQTITDSGADLIAAGTERVTFGPGKRSVMHHVGGDRLFWAAVIYGPESDAGRPPGRKQMLLDRFDGWPGPVCDAIRGTPETAITGLAVYDRKPVKKWGQDRVTLLGDAAHPMTTNTSQGGNQALEDAVVLAHCLRDAPDVAQALRRYEELRIARTSPLVRESRRAANMNSWRDPVRSRFRDVLFGRVLPSVALRGLRATAAVEL
ncbi:MAG: FAD-dependent monooxygenase, partial [Solirubrobacteraceae bacterium]